MSNPLNDTRELGQFIPVHYHYNMLFDKARMTGFRNAIDHIVAPGSTVLELGGGTGVLSFFSARHAKKVYCVELNLDLVDVARRLLKENNVGDKVEVVHGDAFVYLPPEPVDVVVCEMLHVGLLREKQMEVIDSFKKRYHERFGDPMPYFIPGATLQAVQPVYHDFVFEGYAAPLVMFQDPYSVSERTTNLGDPVIFHQLQYDQPYGMEINWSGKIPVTAAGKVNALRIITKNILGFAPETQSIIDWHNQYMIAPLPQEIPVEPGQTLQVSFDYKAGAPLTAFQPVVKV